MSHKLAGERDLINGFESCLEVLLRKSGPSEGMVEVEVDVCLGNNRIVQVLQLRFLIDGLLGETLRDLGSQTALIDRRLLALIVLGSLTSPCLELGPQLRAGPDLFRMDLKVKKILLLRLVIGPEGPPGAEERLALNEACSELFVALPALVLRRFVDPSVLFSA